ncbi:MAG: DNA repair protein RecN, partial [Oscillospiraceae bacterium]
IMLAIKTLISNDEMFSTLIFDEVDSGVSGSSSNKIGIKLKEISKNNQIFCITHSPQIACFADNHFNIIKETNGNETFTRVINLDEESKKIELARIISGDNITEKSLENAEEMIKFARSY